MTAPLIKQVHSLSDLPDWLGSFSPDSLTVNLLGGTTLKIILQDSEVRMWLEGVSVVCMTDERCVPVDSVARNDHQLSDILRRKVSCMVDELGKPCLRSRLPRADISLVGMGTDGHVASIFPGFCSRAVFSAEESSIEQIVLVPDAPDGLPRVSRTLHGLVGRLGTALILKGDNKRLLLQAVQLGDHADLPVARLLSVAPNLLMFVG